MAFARWKWQVWLVRDKLDRRIRKEKREVKRLRKELKQTLLRRSPGGIICQFLAGRALDEAPLELLNGYMVALYKLRRNLKREHFRFFRTHYVLPLFKKRNVHPPCRLLPHPPRHSPPPHCLTHSTVRSIRCRAYGKHARNDVAAPPPPPPPPPRGPTTRCGSATMCVPPRHPLPPHLLRGGGRGQATAVS